MNCSELAVTLENQLLDERDPQWLREARRHAEQCPACSRLLELHQVEEQLTGLCEFEPSGAFVENVMSRVTQPEPHRVLASQRFSPEMLKIPMLVLGTLILAAAYLVPSGGGSWLGVLWPSVAPFRMPGLLAYLSAHPPWAVIVAGIAALVVVLGLALPESPRRNVA